MNKRMKQLRSTSKEDLLKQILELKKQLLKDNSQVLTGVSPKNAGKIKLMKKTVARIHTILGKGEVRKA